MASIYTEADSNTRKTWFLITGFLVFIIAIGWLFSYLLNSNAILYFAVLWVAKDKTFSEAKSIVPLLNRL